MPVNAYCSALYRSLTTLSKFAEDFLLERLPSMKPKANQLLGALEADCMQRLEGELETVDVKLKHVICEAGSDLDHAYFPQGAVLSLLTLMEDGTAIETANIGREGAFGIFAAMYSRVSFNRCLVQLEGPMVRCPIAAIEREFARSANVRNLFVSYSETLLSQVQQTGVTPIPQTVTC